VARKDIIVMSAKEVKRLHVIGKLVEKKIRQIAAAKLLDLTVRQTRRIVKRVIKEGEKGIIHRARGKVSNRKIPQETKDKVFRLYAKHYFDFGPTLASEKLQERDGIGISDETLRLWLIEAQIPYARRKARPHRQWRERKQCFGEMIQIDGSRHDWLADRGPKMVLIGYIDDATGTVFGRFYKYEGTLPVFDSFKRYIKRYKLPHSMYLDKHTTYKSPAKPTIEDELNNRQPQSQFERAMDELGVKVIHANSPQAKGRIERLFRTFQDRLIKEMRLANVCTLEEANRFLEQYLPVHNRRFSVPAVNIEDLHRPVPQGVNLNSVLSIKIERVVRNDFTVLHKGKFYQICEKLRAKKVTVEKWINGSVHIRHRGKTVRYKLIASRPVKEAPKVQWRKRTPYKPPADHPWKRSYKIKVA